MENQSSNQIGMETEDFPDEFQCCVCLDIMYKPVVLACGHISCFWCVFNAMNTYKESHCPVCRNKYNHFPRVCKLLHLLLLKLYPSAYKKRGKLVEEEEKQHRHASSPVFEDELGSQVEEVDDIRKAVPEDSSSSLVGETTILTEENMDTIKTTPDSQTTGDRNATSQQILATDLQCTVCKQLLCRPIVLNCGHVCCRTCVDNQQDGVCRCPECQSTHPWALPNVCLVLEHFLEESFPKEYLARKESLANFHIGCSSSSPPKEQKKESQDSDSQEIAYSSGLDHFLHPGVGCDYCGMYPIIGKRYRCKDCPEAIGFDLCEGCHNSSLKLPGRFNQQHTQEHQLVLEQPRYMRQVMASNNDWNIGVINDHVFVNGGFMPSEDEHINQGFVMGGLELEDSDYEEIENALSQEDSIEGDDAIEPHED